MSLLGDFHVHYCYALFKGIIILFEKKPAGNTVRFSSSPIQGLNYTQAAIFCFPILVVTGTKTRRSTGKSGLGDAAADDRVDSKQACGKHFCLSVQVVRAHNALAVKKTRSSLMTAPYALGNEALVFCTFSLPRGSENLQQKQATTSFPRRIEEIAGPTSRRSRLTVRSPLRDTRKHELSS